MSHFASIIVPVYKDCERFKQCLKLLGKQTHTKSSYEVIVTNSSSIEHLKSVVSQFNRAIYAFESALGSYSARNKALSIARGKS